MQSVEKTWFERAAQEDVNTAEPAAEEIIAKDEKISVASYGQLMWWRFLKHRMAVISAVIVLLFYLVGAFCEVVAPYDPEESFIKYKLAPPSRVHIFDTQGNLQRPFVYKINRERDSETLRSIYTEDTSTIYPIRFFVQGSEYKLWGRWPMSLHLIGLAHPAFREGLERQAYEHRLIPRGFF